MSLDLGLDLWLPPLFAVCLLMLCALSGNLVFLAWTHSRRQKAMRGPQRPVMQGDRSHWPHVLIQIPVFNERDVVERIVGAVARLDWPKDRLTIQVLDDSTDDTIDVTRAIVERLCREGVDVRLRHRVDRLGFKAGALAEGMAEAPGEFIAIFDADFIPSPDFLLRTIPTLHANDRLAFVQTRWEHLNGGESLLTRAQTLMLDAHFGIEQAVRSWLGLMLPFNGTCGIWRRAAIEDAGGWRADTLTEDLDLSLRAHFRGWKAEYLREVTVPGELPSSIPTWRVQQYRWTKGFAQVARKLLGELWRSGRPFGFKLATSLQLLQCLFYPTAAASLVLGLAMLTFRVDQPVPLIVLGVVATVLGFFGPLLFILSGQLALRPGRIRDFPLAYLAVIALNAGLALSNSRAVIEGFAGHRSAFVRTPKKGDRLRTAYRSQSGPSGVPELAAAITLSVMLIGNEAWMMPFLTVSAAGLAMIGVSLLRERLADRAPPSAPAGDRGTASAVNR